MLDKPIDEIVYEGGKVNLNLNRNGDLYKYEFKFKFNGNEFIKGGWCKKWWRDGQMQASLL